MTATTMTRTTRKEPPAMKIAKAAVTYARIRRQVMKLPRKCDQAKTDALYEAMYAAEDELLTVCKIAGGKIAGAV